MLISLSVENEFLRRTYLVLDKVGSASIDARVDFPVPCVQTIDTTINWLWSNKKWDISSPMFKVSSIIFTGCVIILSGTMGAGEINSIKTSIKYYFYINCFNLEK